MWPWEYTAVWSRAGDQVRRVRWISSAMKALPVSTRNKPSPVSTADTLANDGTNETPSATSASPVDGLSGWIWLVDTSPRHSWSATANTSSDPVMVSPPFSSGPCPALGTLLGSCPRWRA